MITKSEIDGNHPAGHYLVVEDPESPTTWHLRVRDASGKVDHRLMGAAWAALHGGYRGNKYEGPRKQEAIGKLRSLYESEEMPVPAEKAGRRNSMKDQDRLNKILELVLQLGGLMNEEDEEDDEEDEEEGGMTQFMERGGFVTYKDKNTGNYRWLTVSSSAYEDWDGQIVSTKALEDDVFNRKDPDLGPLRWRHVGEPDYIAQKSGPGLDIGHCDFSTMWGKLLVESGTYKSNAIAEKVASGGPYEVSLGFFHPLDQPDSDGVFRKIKRFERSLLPAGSASNKFTSFTGGIKMSDKQKAKKDLCDLLGDELGNQVAAQLEAKEKAADNSGATFKERIKGIFAAFKSGEQAQPKKEDEAPKKIGDMTAEELRAILAPQASAEAKEKADVEEDAVAAVKEAQVATLKRVEAIETGMKALLAELEELVGKPGYRPSKDTSTVKAQKEDTGGIDSEVMTFLDGGSK